VYDCSLISDGAAAVLIAPLERAAEFTSKPREFLALRKRLTTSADQKDDITTLRAVVSAAQKAYKMQGSRRGILNLPKCTIAHHRRDPRHRRFGFVKKAKADRSRSPETRV